MSPIPGVPTIGLERYDRVTARFVNREITPDQWERALRDPVYADELIGDAQDERVLQSLANICCSQAGRDH